METTPLSQIPQLFSQDLNEKHTSAAKQALTFQYVYCPDGKMFR